MQLVQTNGVKSAYCWHLAIYDLIDYANAFNFGLNSFVNISMAQRVALGLAKIAIK